jgi:plastocyanin
METTPHTVTWTDTGQRAHHLRITPKRLARGSASDLTNVHMMEDDLKGKVPYYLTVSYTNTDQDALLRPTPEDDFSVNGVDGQPGKAVSMFSDGLGTGPSLPDQCGKSGPDKLAPGGTAQVCQIFMLSPKQQPATVSYTDDNGGAVIWQISGDKADAASDVLPAGKTAASVWQDSDNHTVPLSVTPKSVRTGDLSDLSQYDLSADDKKLVPYYVTIEYRNAGSYSLYPDMHESVLLRGASGQEAKALTLLNLNLDGSGNGISQCPEAVPNKEVQPQGTVTECTVHMLPKSDYPLTVVFQGKGSGAQPVTWHAAEGSK